ncbi:MAG: MBL fold metallo-hydrolase, partial [Thermoleophilia bacterium]|nr:MBL fold metallo-hydrolase [Thermoleophilia bacterium]
EDLASPWGLIMRKQRVAGPPWYVTWNRRAARASVDAMAALEPLALAPGHGVPMAGPDVPEKVRACADGRQ